LQAGEAGEYEGLNNKEKFGQEISLNYWLFLLQLSDPEF
jgi:hypothetical protein